MPFTFAIVNFLETNEVEVVPLSWISDDLCFWPPLKAVEARKLVRKLVKPTSDWLGHQAKVMGRYETFEAARKNLQKSADTSDLASEAEELLGKGKRRHIPTKEWSDDDSCSLNFTETTGIVAPQLPNNFNDVHKQYDLQHCDEDIEQQGNIQHLAETEHQEETTVVQVVTAEQLAGIESAISSVKKDFLYIKEMLKVVLKNQDAIMNKLCAPEVPISSSESGSLPFSLPIKTMQELYSVETALQNSSITEHLTKRLIACGGDTVVACVKRILIKLMDDAVAQHFSWVGAKGKQAFCRLLLNAVVFDAIRRNAALPHATEAAIEKAIKDYLRHAKARHNSKMATGPAVDASQSII